MISKFNKILLEKYPLIYHSKAPYLITAGLVLWLFSYVVGYIALDSEDILEVSLRNFYYSSLFVALHILICIITVSIWAIHFYRLNPLKHIYPLQKYYYTKLLLILSIPFWFMVSAKEAFDVGAYNKFQHLVSVDEMEEDGKSLNLGNPFLLSNLEDYSLANRSYPKPFPVKYFFRVDDTDGWSNSGNINAVEDYSIVDYDKQHYNELYYNKDFNQDKYISSDLLTNNRLLEFLNDSVNHTIVESTPYVFYSSESKYTGPDSCKSYNVFSRLEDVSGINLIHSSIYNFSTRAFGRSKLDDETLSQLHQILDRRGKSEIKQILDQYINVLDKYKIRHSLIDVDRLVDYHISKSFESYDIELVNQYSSYNHYYDSDDDYSVVREYTPLEKELKEVNMRVDFSGIQTLSSNYSLVYRNTDWIDYEFWQLYGGLALFIAMFFIWFEFMEIKSLLISIPIAGVLGIIFASGMELMQMYNLRFGSSSGQSIRMIYTVLYCLIIIGSTNFLVKRKHTNRKMASIGMNLTYYLSCFIFLLILGTINQLTEYTYLDTCRRTIYVEPVKNYLGDLEYYVLPLGFIGVSLFYRLVKPWKAKKKSS